MNDKKVKVGMSFMNWVLSFAGILVFLSFIALPPFFRLAYPKEEPVEDISGKIPMEALVCKIENHSTPTYTENQTINIRYYIDQIRTYTKDTVQTYKDVETFEADKQEYGRLSSAYSLVEGVSYDVSPDSVNLKITISEKYELGQFVEKDVILPGEEEPIKVTSNYTLEDSLTKVKTDLTALGYTCSEVTQ